MYKVQFDDGTCQDVYASRLHVESHFASLPPDAIAAGSQTPWGAPTIRFHKSRQTVRF